ncbi:hypothetical protein L6452_05467 [Arctium lappa]|uniref:Uncharacterized protein n=1 Tax=Arctium lappa TaxID=4217 RepID=A0ACB9EH58_ARCLA|nr:hypothetical protein L6452_05467 [Arctium lappa]
MVWLENGDGGGVAGEWQRWWCGRRTATVVVWPENDIGACVDGEKSSLKNQMAYECIPILEKEVDGRLEKQRGDRWPILRAREISHHDGVAGERRRGWCGWRMATVVVWPENDNGGGVAGKRHRCLCGWREIESKKSNGCDGVI